MPKGRRPREATWISSSSSRLLCPRSGAPAALPRCWPPSRCALTSISTPPKRLKATHASHSPLSTACWSQAERCTSRSIPELHLFGLCPLIQPSGAFPVPLREFVQSRLKTTHFEPVIRFSADDHICLRELRDAGRATQLHRDL